MWELVDVQLLNDKDPGAVFPWAKVKKLSAIESDLGVPYVTTVLAAGAALAVIAQTWSTVNYTEVAVLDFLAISLQVTVMDYVCPNMIPAIIRFPDSNLAMEIALSVVHS